MATATATDPLTLLESQIADWRETHRNAGIGSYTARLAAQAIRDLELAHAAVCDAVSLNVQMELRRLLDELPRPECGDKSCTAKYRSAQAMVRRAMGRGKAGG